MLTTKQLKKMSMFTLVAFVFSMFASFSTTANAALLSLPISSNSANTTVTVSDYSALNSVLPELTSLQSSLRSAETTARTLETVATPIYNTVVPTNMEAMSIAERCKAIINNAKNVLGDTLKTSANNANSKVAQGASVLSLESDEKIAFGIQELGKQASKLDNLANNYTAVQKIKSVLSSVKETLSKLTTNVREKIFKVGQKAGLIDENKVFENGKVVDKSEATNSNQASQSAYGKNSGAKSSFTSKLSSGLQEGIANAKTSLKNSFSIQNLAITTAVSVGTSLAVDAINGETPSLKKAVKQVASLEFAGNVVGSALGAAGGQVVGTLVKTFVPGVVGNLIGSVIPVMFASANGQLTSNIITGLKNGEFSISKAFKQIDKADLVGSSIGSTIGMTLGSLIPVPVVGTIVGGIVGGVVGSKIAKFVTGLFGKKKNNTASSATVTTTASSAKSATFGAANSVVLSPTIETAEDTVVTSSSSSTSNPEKAKIKKMLNEVQEKYMDAYHRYNKKIEQNDIEGSREVFEELKKYSDEYSTLRRALR